MIAGALLVPAISFACSPPDGNWQSDNSVVFSHFDIHFGNSNKVELNVVGVSSVTQQVTFAMRDTRTGQSYYLASISATANQQFSIDIVKDLANSASQFRDGDNVVFYAYRSSLLFYYVCSNIPQGWVSGNVHEPVLTIGDIDVDCETHSLQIPLAANFSIQSVDSVKLGGSIVQYAFDRDTWIVYISGVVFNQNECSLEISASGNMNGEDVSASASASVDCSPCVQSQNVPAYEIKYSVLCYGPADNPSGNYDILISVLKDGNEYDNFSYSYKTQVRDNADFPASANKNGSTIKITSGTQSNTDRIDSYEFDISIGGIDLNFSIENPACAVSGVVDYDSKGNKIKEKRDDIISLLKSIFEKIKMLVDVVIAIVKIIYNAIVAVLSVFPFMFKWVAGVITVIYGFVFEVIKGLLHPSAQFTLQLPSSQFVDIPSLISLIAYYIKYAFSIVPQWVWWFIAGFILLPVFTTKFSNNSDNGSDSWTVGGG